MTWGWFRPVVMLPAEADAWLPERRRSVLLHELAHVQRLDCLTQSVAQVVCALYWFNPLAWFAAHRMRVERERACDDLVLASGTRASDYAGHLLEMARGFRYGRAAALGAVAMGRPSQLEGRLHAILDPKVRRGRITRAGTVLALIGLAAVLSPLSAVRLKAQDPAPERNVATEPKPDGPGRPARRSPRK